MIPLRTARRFCFGVPWGKSMLQTNFNADRNVISVPHQTVLRGLKSLSIPGYEVLVEERGGRLDFPNENFQANWKATAQRKRNLCYADALVHAQRIPRVLIEVVDKQPCEP